jgi:hypothetical protein
MLRVVYEATHDLEPGQMVELTETRGQVTVRIRHGVQAHEYAGPLNAALERFVGECGWFQIWRGQVMSAASPENPLTVQFTIDSEIRLPGVQIRESRGVVRLHVCAEVLSQDLVQALNPAIENFLRGGQWFQLWQGEIVTMDSPATVESDAHA